jgi:hypothetical protein
MNPVRNEKQLGSPGMTGLRARVDGPTFLAAAQSADRRSHSRAGVRTLNRSIVGCFSVIIFHVSLAAAPYPLASNSPGTQSAAASAYVFSKERWAKAGFLNAEVIAIPLPAAPKDQKNLTHALTVYPVMFRNSGWTVQQIESQLKKTSVIFAACGIQIYSVQLTIADVPAQFLSVTGKKEAYVVHATPITNRPIVYFVKTLIDRENHSLAHSLIKKDCQKDPLGCDTVWLSVKVNLPDDKLDPSFGTLAHELAHIIGNTGHTPPLRQYPANLLSPDLDYANGRLLPEQCQAFKQYPGLVRLSFHPAAAANH